MKKYYEFTSKAFGQEKVDQRYSHLLSMASNFLESRNIEKYVAINRSVLKEMVIDYFSDSKRIKDFLYQGSLRSKNICSYLGYWIIRKKPLVLISKTDYKLRMKKPFLEYINEWFSFHLILGYKISPSDYYLFYDI